MQRLIYTTLCALLIVVCQPAYADDLESAIECGIHAYADTQPSAGGWAQQLIAELGETDKSKVVKLSEVKYWMFQSQKQDGNPLREERIGTMSNSIQSCLTPLPDRQVTAGDIIDRADAILDRMYPAPEEVTDSALRDRRLMHGGDK